MTIPFIEENDQTLARKEHLAKLAEIVGNVYPNKFSRSTVSGVDDTISAIVEFEAIAKLLPQLAAGEKPAPELKEAINIELKNFGTVRVAGRLTTPPRLQGKASFLHLSDGKKRLQTYFRKNEFAVIKNDAENSEDAENSWTAFSLLDHGDFIGVEGFLFLTNTGELTVHVEKIQFLAKAMLPMPDKIHGIEDAELKQRRRYFDLIAASLKVETEAEKASGIKELNTREVFERRAKIVSAMRNFLEAHGYIEVETPMLTPKATGAAARPFQTHHNALDIDLYARIAPELYLKRLVVGGFERVYELNRNFRNEGISTRHNPEFTMLEFYCAYMDVNGMMDFCEELLKDSVQKATGGLKVKFGENGIDFSQFERISMKEAIFKYWDKAIKTPVSWYLIPSDPKKMIIGDFEKSWLDDFEKLVYIAAFCNARHTVNYFFITDHKPNGWKIITSENMKEQTFDDRKKIVEGVADVYREKIRKNTTDNIDVIKQKMIVEIFEKLIEPVLIQPTFIIDFPKAVSPLSKASPENPAIAERFELYINGMEIANGFSELNDPQEQYERFLDQGKERERGDDEAMILDEDYIRALSYGMPPAAGIGIGIDRLTMLATNRQSIRDVILFPHLRPETVNS